MVAIAGWPSNCVALTPLRPNNCIANSWKRGGGRNPAGTNRRALRQALPQPDLTGSRSRPTAPGDSLATESPGGLPVPVSFSGRPKNVDRFRSAEIGDDHPSAALPLLPRDRYCEAWAVV